MLVVVGCTVGLGLVLVWRLGVGHLIPSAGSGAPSLYCSCLLCWRWQTEELGRGISANKAVLLSSCLARLLASGDSVLAKRRCGELPGWELQRRHEAKGNFSNKLVTIVCWEYALEAIIKWFISIFMIIIIVYSPCYNCIKWKHNTCVEYKHQESLVSLYWTLPLIKR